MELPVIVVPTVTIAGSDDLFPVRRIFCVGQNYADHVREMGGDPDRSPPFFFSKPADAVVRSGLTIPFPSLTHDLHYEIELVVALGGGGSDIAPAEAEALIFGYAAGIDLTRRDIQAVAKEKGRPWDMAKGFDQSAPVGTITRGAPPSTGMIKLALDGETRQSGNLAQMIWKVPEVLSTLSKYVALSAGDLIFTGTPAGVGPVARGQTLRGMVAGAEPIEVSFI
jgi:fumarylpyruvate hydrolase